MPLGLSSWSEEKSGSGSSAAGAALSSPVRAKKLRPKPKVTVSEDGPASSAMPVSSVGRRLARHQLARAVSDQRRSSAAASLRPAPGARSKAIEMAAGLERCGDARLMGAVEAIAWSSRAWTARSGRRRRGRGCAGGAARRAQDEPGRRRPRRSACAEHAAVRRRSGACGFAGSRGLAEVCRSRVGQPILHVLVDGHLVDVGGPHGHGDLPVAGHRDLDAVRASSGRWRRGRG